MCSPLVSLSVAIRCFNKDDDTDCSMPVRPGTRAKAECKQSYTPIKTHRYIDLLCRDDGQWNYDLFYCQPGKTLMFQNFVNVSLAKPNEIACIQDKFCKHI